MRRIAAEIWNYKAATVGALAICFGLFGVYAYFVPKDSTVPTYYLFIVLAIFVILISPFVLAIIRLSDAIERLPELLRVTERSMADGTKQVIFLLGASRIVGMGIGCSVYFVSDGFELLIAEGFVSNVQQDGKIQIVLTSVRPEHSDELQRLARNEADALRAVIVKPGTQAGGA